MSFDYTIRDSSDLDVAVDRSPTVSLDTEALLLNKQRFINKYLEELNGRSATGEKSEVVFESADQREERLFYRIRPVLLRRFIVLLDFVYHRAWPKMWLTKSTYFWLTQGKYRVMTFAEVLGRILSCSFQITELKEKDGKWFVSLEKAGHPAFDLNPTYSLLVTLTRVGKEGKKFEVHKLRTMSPYAEYLQHFLHERNGLGEGGKIKADIRVTPWGRFLRRFWIDELPMIWNVLKGDLKLVGVRPVSEHRFLLFPEEFQKARAAVRPGLLPACYADTANSFDEIMKSEMEYLEKYSKSPMLTDISYIFRIIPRILLRKVGTA